MPEQNRSWLDRLLGRSGKDRQEQVDPCDDPSVRSMVNCGHVRESASDFIDGDVEPSLTRKIKVHLGICGDCSGWVKSLAATVGLTRQLPQQEVPDSLKEQIKKITRST